MRRPQFIARFPSRFPIEQKSFSSPGPSNRTTRIEIIDLSIRKMPLFWRSSNRYHSAVPPRRESEVCGKRFPDLRLDYRRVDCWNHFCFKALSTNPRTDRLKKRVAGCKMQPILLRSRQKKAVPMIVVSDDQFTALKPGEAPLVLGGGARSATWGAPQFRDLGTDVCLS
jgi:hypothetical protein